VLNILPEPAAEVIPEVKPEPAPREEMTMTEKISRLKISSWHHESYRIPEGFI
jgi:hypothetical protein